MHLRNTLGLKGWNGVMVHADHHEGCFLEQVNLKRKFQPRGIGSHFFLQGTFDLLLGLSWKIARM